jgi:large repetitive protein
MAVVLREETGGSAIDYLYGLDLIAQGDGASNSYLMADGLGSTRFLTDENGSVVARYTYDVFGLERSKTGSGETDFTFAGEQMDKDTGLQYLRARYYDPEDGGWRKNF